VLESIYRISRERMNNAVDTGLPTAPINRNAVVEDLVKCGY